MVDLENAVFSNWMSKVCNILTKTNFNNIWDDTELIIHNPDSFLLSFKEEIYSITFLNGKIALSYFLN